MKRIVGFILALVLIFSQSGVAYCAEQFEDTERQSTEEIIKQDHPVNENIELMADSDDGEINAGDNIIITAESKTEDENYEYCFVLFGDNPQLLQDFSSNNQYSFLADQEGQYTIRVILRDDLGNLSMQVCTFETSSDTQTTEESGVDDTGQNESLSKPSNNGDDQTYVDVPESSTIGNTYSDGNINGRTFSPISLTISSDKTGAQASGETLVLTASASGGDGNYEYRFTETYNDIATTVQNYSSSSSYEYKAKGIGIHKFTVAVRDGSGNAMSATYSVTIKEQALSLNIGSDKSGTLASGNSIIINAAAVGGDGEYEYRFTETYNGVSTTVQNYSEKSSYEYKTKGIGVHKFTVAVRDGSGNAMSGTYSVTVKEQALSLTISGDKSGTLAAGNSIVISTTAVGGDGDYEYRFTETYNGISTTVQNYSESSTYEYKAKGDGTHKFTVAVRDKSGNAMSGTYLVTVKDQPLKLSVNSDKSGTQPVGSIVTIKATATGGDENYEYRFTETYNGVSTTVQNYSENATYVYKAKGSGTHKFTVAVRDGSGNAMSGTYSVAVKKQALSLTISGDKSGTLASGNSITINATAVGGDGDYEYRFTETYNGIATTVQNYSENATYEYKATGNGLHKFTVAVRDGSGDMMSGTYLVTVKEVPFTLSISGDKSGTQPAGSIITIKASAAGGDGNYEYRFTETYNGIATTVQNYSENATYEYKARGNGVHKFTVAVRDGNGKATSGNYSITVNEMPLQVKILSNKKTSVNKGTVVTLTANATGGFGGYEYRFTETYNGVSTTKQGYSSDNTYTFTAGELGQYKYTIAVRDSEGQIMSSSYVMNVVENVRLEGIDVSSWQGTIDWKQVSNAGVDFAMIRILSGKMGALTVDSQFYNNIKNAKQNGIKVGVYRYGYAMTVDEARREANMVVQALKNSGCSLDFPVAYDVEDAETQGTLSRAELSNIIQAFREVIEANGYKFMIYSGLYWLNTKVPMENFKDVDVWVAQYWDYTPNHGHDYRGYGNVTIWQYSSRGKVPGISTDVDMNIGYYNY